MFQCVVQSTAFATTACWCVWRSWALSGWARQVGMPRQALGSSRQQTRTWALTTSPDPLELGVVEPGHPASRTLSVRNPGAEPVEVARVDTSCECVRVAGLPMRFGAGETRELCVLFALPTAESFRGSLSVDVTGYSAAGYPAFQTKVNLEVVNEDAGVRR